MRNYISLGPISLRISRKGIVSWGYELLRIGGFTFWTRSNNGGLCLATYRSPTNTTWHWYVAIERRSPEARRGWIERVAPERRRGQWHDYYRLPFGWQVIVGHQDFHLRPKAAETA